MAHAIFTAAIFGLFLTCYKANADFTHDGRSDLAGISDGNAWQASLSKNGRLDDYPGHQQ